ncbi:MAG: hypothetical protein AB4368_28590 [Xenococcaceae cyanobacterium]
MLETLLLSQQQVAIFNIFSYLSVIDRAPNHNQNKISKLIFERDRARLRLSTIEISQLQKEIDKKIDNR